MVFAINFNQIIAFILGIVAGATLVLATLMIVLSREKKKAKMKGSLMEDITKEKIQEMISLKQDKFIDLVENDDYKMLKAEMEVILELIHEVSSYYYPDSKYPEYEMTISEACEIIHYITNQIEKMFDKPVLKTVKNVKLSFIMKTVDGAKKVKNNKAVKAVNEKGGKEAYKAAMTVKNTINPVYWFRKVVVNGVLNAALKKVCKAGIRIVGNETNKVYSKSILKRDNDEDIKMDDFEEIYNDEV